MINGRILMTEDRIQQTVIEMLALGSRDSAIQHMHYVIDRQCEWWHLTTDDGILLRIEMVGRYDHYEKFFDKPDKEAHS